MDKTASRPQGRKRIMALAVAGLAVVSMTAGATSLALFTDTETTDETLTAGTIILDAAKIDALTLDFGTNVMPGDTVTEAVEVSNTGANELRYSLNSSTTSVAGPNGGVINAALLVTVKVADGADDCSTFTGSTLQAQEVLGASNVLFGDPSTANVGGGDRTVAASASDWICIRVSLPGATGDTYQGATATTTFTFNAEQTENN